MIIVLCLNIPLHDYPMLYFSTFSLILSREHFYPCVGNYLIKLDQKVSCFVLSIIRKEENIDRKLDLSGSFTKCLKKSQKVIFILFQFFTTYGNMKDLCLWFFFFYEVYLITIKFKKLKRFPLCFTSRFYYLDWFKRRI